MGSIVDRIEYILKHNILIQRIYKTTFSFIFRFIGLFIKIDNKLILFNAHGKKYNDSPRAIYEYMCQNDFYKEFKFVWALDEPSNYDLKNAYKVKMDSASYFIIALKAKYWISCVNIERGLNFKKKETIYLNTWHGTPIKYIGNAVSGRRDFDFSTIDLFCYSGMYEKKIYLRDFNIPERSLLLSGLPRNDELYNVSLNKVKNYKKELKLPEDKKVILYAPTWRDSKDKGNSYSLNPPIDISFLEEELKDEYVLLLRTHSYTNNLMGFNFNEFARDYSAFPDINKLLMVADVLVSDYSATIFDYSILEKPIICFAYDYYEYTKERGLYINLKKEFPGGIISTQEELVKKLKTMDYKKECKRIKSFKETYLQVGGDATKKCIEHLLK